MDSTPNQPRDPALSTYAEDFSQARARYFFVILTGLFTAGYAMWPPVGSSVVSAYVWIELIAVAIYNTLIIHVVQRAGSREPWWRYTNVVVDVAAASSVMIALGPVASVFYPLLLWIVIGHGMRFGLRLLWIAQGVSVAGFGTVIAMTPFWRDNLSASLGFLGGIIALPLFFSALIGRLQNLHARLEQQLERASYTALHDTLTALPNRLSFNERIADEIAMANRTGHPFTLVYVDLEGFKSVNDSLGHRYGDDVLKQTADRLRQVTRRSDFIARLGGDEFVILLPMTRRADALRLSERLKSVLANDWHVGPKTVRIGGSVGMAVFPENGETIDLLLTHADHEMYRDKALSKRRTSAAPIIGATHNTLGAVVPAA